MGAAAAGMTAVHLRRGPLALLHPAQGGHRIDGLDELPALLRALRSRNWPPGSEVLQHRFRPAGVRR